MNSKDAQALKDAISTNLGYMGVGSLQIGSTVIQATAPPILTECVGAGDTIRVGDVVTDLSQSRDYPHRIEAIFPSDRRGIGPGILSREFDADPAYHGVTSYCAWGGGWCRNFKVLNQADVDAWFASAKAIRADGWHKLPSFKGRVLVSRGVPVEIERGSARVHMGQVVDLAEQMLGFDITPCRMYANLDKTVQKVKRAVRRLPPKI